MRPKTAPFNVDRSAAFPNDKFWIVSLSLGFNIEAGAHLHKYPVSYVEGGRRSTPSSAAHTCLHVHRALLIATCFRCQTERVQFKHRMGSESGTQRRVSASGAHPTGSASSAQRIGGASDTRRIGSASGKQCKGNASDTQRIGRVRRGEKIPCIAPLRIVSAAPGDASRVFASGQLRCSTPPVITLRK